MKTISMLCKLLLFIIPILQSIIASQIDPKKPSSYLKMLRSPLIYITLALYIFSLIGENCIEKIPEINKDCILCYSTITVLFIIVIALVVLIIWDIRLKNLDDLILRQNYSYRATLNKQRKKLTKKLGDDVMNEKFATLENTDKAISLLNQKVDQLKFH